MSASAPAVLRRQINAANGVAGLDANGKLPASLTQIVGAERFSNPGFESGIAVGWNYNAGGARATENSIIHSGTTSLKQTYVSGTWTSGAATQTLTVVPGTVMLFSFWSYGDGAHPGTYAIYDGTHAVYFLASQPVASSAAAWIQTSVYFTVPAGCTSLYFYLGCPAGTVYWDDASVKPILSAGAAAASTSYTDTNSISATDVQAALDALTGGIKCAVALPATIPAVVGQELNIYFDNVIRSYQHTSGLDIDVTCASGTQQNERFTFTPGAGDVGTIAFSMTAAADGIVMATGTANIVVKATACTATRKLLAIGDSTTAGGQWLSEVVGLGALTSFTVTTAGTVTSANVPDFRSATHTVRHEGYSGQSINWFYTNASSPFVFSAAFNFATYLSNNSITLASADWVTFHLGINDVFAATTDAAMVTALATMKTQLDAMIANIKATVSGIRIGLMITIPPSQDQDAFGKNYGAGQTRARHRRNVGLLHEWMILNYAAVAGVVLIPVHIALDTRNNMSTETVALNAYNAATIVRQSNGVHPANAGYFQMGQAVYAAMRGQEA